MKCFHFTNGEREELKEGGLGVSGVVSRSISKVSWARSLSIASSSSTTSTSFLQDIRKSSSTSTGFDSSDASNEDFLSFSQRRKDSCCNNVVNELKVFTYAELKSGTRGFSRSLVIGEGGFGCVYRGVVKLVNNEKLDVAIKQLNRNGFQGHKEWINEVNYLGVVKHPNLVKLVGYCAEDDERGMQRLLVYELMRNKSLEDHLLARIPAPLPWMARLKIAQDAARGLAHLHEEMNFQLIFRDFKTSNILIDEDFNAKLSDFGLARQGPAEGNSHVSTDVVGTVGYAAPEYVQTGKLTAKSDVWSFGVVLYELITGRRAVERNLPRGEQKLLEWAKPYASDPKKFYLILDPRLQGEDCLKSAKKLASLANKCLMKNPKSRPKMSEAVEILQNIIDETSSHDEDVSQQVEVEVAEEVKEEPADEGELTKPGNKYLKKVFDFREMVSLKNKSIGKLDWKNWTPGLLRT